MEKKNNRENCCCVVAAAGIAVLLLASGCSTTVESQPEAAKAVESGGPLPASVTSFLGPDSSKVGARTKGRRGVGLGESERAMGKLHQDLAGSCSVLGGRRFQSLHV